MSWGSGLWGAGSPWGTGVSLPPPSVVGVSTDVAERRGGTVLRVLGTGFVDSMVVDLLQAGVFQGAGYIFDPRFDVESNRAWVGMPALDDGVYDLRVTTSGGSATLAAAVTFKLHAEEYKVVHMRSKWPSVWDAGTRYLRGS